MKHIHINFPVQIQRRDWQNLAMLPNSSFAAILPGDSLAGAVVANGFFNFLNTYNTLLVVRLVLTWFPNAPPAVVGPLRYEPAAFDFSLHIICIASLHFQSLHA